MELKQASKSGNGFTLVELLVVLSITGIVLAIALPSFNYVIVRNRITTNVNTLVSTLQSARSEAIKRGTSVTVCSSNDGSTCRTTSVNEWAEGYIAFADANANATVDAQDTILQRVRGTNSSSIATTTFAYFATATNGTRAVTYNGQGFVIGLAANPVLVHFTNNRDFNNASKRCLSIGRTGRLTVLSPGQGGCT
jgi:type IV fimbrial biogenesis protein FimT